MVAGCKMWSFWKIPSGAEKALWASCNVPFIVDRLEWTYTGCRPWELRESYRFSSRSLNGRRNTAEKVLCFTSKVPFILDQSWPNLQYCVSWALSTICEVSGKSLEWKKRYSGEGVKMWSALHCSLIASKLTSVVDHGRNEYRIWTFRKMLWMEEGIQRRGYGVLM
jgi:hypothetical protein